MFKQCCLLFSGVPNIWFVSDAGSDQNNCHTESTPCRYLQTILDRATDGADIYVTSDTLTLDVAYSTIDPFSGPTDICLVNSSLSYNISSANGTAFQLLCGVGTLGEYNPPVGIVCYQTDCCSLTDILCDNFVDTANFQLI